MNIDKSLLQDYFKSFDTSKLDDLHHCGQSFPAWHLEMLKDRARLDFYKNLLEHKVKDKIVLDIGAGSGILSYLALRFGAKKVYSVEFNPHMQVVYTQLMAAPLTEKRAVLLDMDANNLTLDFFGHDRPEVIVQEIYGANGLSEDVIAVFKALQKNGITQNALILPQICQIMIEPVYSEFYDSSFDLEEFEGFPLNILSQLGSWKVLDLPYENAGRWVNSGEEKMLAQIDLQNPVMENVYSLQFNNLRDYSHLRLSIRVMDGEKVLASSHGQEFSHWTNLYFPIPKWHRKEDETAIFEIAKENIYLSRYVSART